MVASKTKKVMKYTYPERVLGSFSLIQREHKKHAIHLASLRAQILKTANARKDKLGPHWKNWVGKAVQRLEERGILSSEPAGTVALTPNGKKAILAARRALALPMHESLSPDEEDLLWKQVTHPTNVQVIPPAVKRTRHTAPFSDEEDSDPEYVPRKRARTSLGTRATSSKTSDPAFKMTKAQLVAELDSMRRTQETNRLRAESPLTELEDDESEEVMRLKEILKHKDEEMCALQRQLEARTEDDHFDTEMSSPLRPNLNLINRTQSGSLIDHLSKQPTPAPTEPDLDDHTHDNIYRLLNKHSNYAPQNCRILYANYLSSKPNTPKPKHRSPTKFPAFLFLQTNLALRETQISERDAAISRIPDLERAKADLEGSIAEKATQIQRLIHERDDALVNLKNEKDKHADAMASLRTESNHELEIANTRVTTLESDIAKLRSELDSQRASAADLFGERACLEEELSAQRALVGTADESNQLLVKRVAELDQRVVEHNAIELSLKEKIARTEAELSTASEKLSAAETKNKTLTGRLAETTEKLTEARQGLTDARAAAEALKPQMAALDDALTTRISSYRELQERLTKTQHDADTFRLQMGILETTVSNLRATLESKTSQADQLARDLIDRTGANAALASSIQEKEEQLTDANISKDLLQSALDEVTSELHDQLDVLDAAKTSLISELAAKSAMLEETVIKLREAGAREETLGTEITVKDDEIKRLHVQLSEYVGRVEGLEQSLAATETRYASDIADRESANIALENSLSSAQEDVSRLTLEAASLRQNLDDVQGRLDNITDALDAEKQRGKLIQADCEHANSRVQEVEQELLELRASKDTDEATIEDLKAAFSQLKATQMQTLAELDNKVGSAQSTPVPKRRAPKVPSTRSV
ncbi:Aminotransferase [Mycena sanguinolenta]|uniref:Aminotransferase n=1 Tax=Mycena sanguinolenta TaxID=230812 RepID=A0A8H6Y3W7_9AGAR|nr:Aminotransferase [Mycena sanguinolenta]